MSSYAQSADATWDRGAVFSLSAGERIVLESLERSALTIDEYAKRLIDFSESSSEATRRLLALRRRYLLEDNWGTLCKAALKNWLRPEVYSMVVGPEEDQADVTRNPAKDIWREGAVLYKRAALRTTRRIKSNGEKYLALLAGTDFNLFWQTVELYVEAFNDVIIWPSVISDGRGQRVLQHRIATPDMVTVIARRDQPTVLDAVLLIDTYSDEKSDQRHNYYLWTSSFGGAAWYAAYNDKLERIDTGENPDVNPYGGLGHMVAIHKDPFATRFWSPSIDEDLVNLSILTGRNRTFDHFTRKMSGFTQIMQWGESPVEPKLQLRSEGAVLTFDTGPGGGVREVEWKANLIERADLIDRDISYAAAARGINPQKFQGGNGYQAAGAVTGNERALAERRQTKIETYSTSEDKYYHSVCLVARVHQLRPPAELPSDDDSLDTEHAMPELAGEPEKVAALLEKRVALGQESPVTLARREHPEWTEDQCREFVQKNVEDTAWFQGLRSAHQVPNKLSNSSLAAEQQGAQGPAVRDGAPQQPPSGTLAGERQISEAQSVEEE